jgi:hypothetical protein
MLVFDLSNVGVGGGVAGRCANAESTCVCLCVCPWCVRIRSKTCM